MNDEHYLGSLRQAVDGLMQGKEKLYSLWEKGEVRLRNDDIEQLFEELHKVEETIPELKEVIAAFQSMNEIKLKADK